MSESVDRPKVVSFSDSARAVAMKDHPSNHTYTAAGRDYLMSVIRKQDEALQKIEEILDNHSFGYDVDAPTVVEADLIRAVLVIEKGE